MMGFTPASHRMFASEWLRKTSVARKGMDHEGLSEAVHDGALLGQGEPAVKGREPEGQVGVGVLFPVLFDDFFQLQGDVPDGSVRRQVGVDPCLAPVRHDEALGGAEKVPDVVNQLGPFLLVGTGKLDEDPPQGFPGTLPGAGQEACFLFLP
jgi:hypothetical protein